jgi:hypothetical protein
MGGLVDRNTGANKSVIDDRHGDDAAADPDQKPGTDAGDQAEADQASSRHYASWPESARGGLLSRFLRTGSTRH